MIATNMHIRWMIRRDMEEVLAIENNSFDTPWSEEEVLDTLRKRNCIGMVVEIGEQIVGFMIYNLHKHHLDIVDFAVHPNFRRQSIGRRMVDKLFSKLSENRRTRITLTVSEANLSAQLFFRSQAFKATSVVREHFGVNDGYLMQYELKE